MKIIESIGKFFSSNKVLYGLIVLVVFLPLALFVIPTMTSTSAVESALYEDDDPMFSIVSTRDVEVIEKESTPVVTGGNATSSNTEPVMASSPVARSGNYLSIPGRVSSVVVGVGIGADGAIEVPASAIGMYNHGGAIFLDGHSTGVFAGLSGVRVGDIVEFTLNSVTSQYQVVNIVTYVYFDGTNFDQSFMADSLFSGGANGLNMMTCAGAYLPAYGTYSHRLVVYSVKVE